jgi:hypothetical protein
MERGLREGIDGWVLGCELYRGNKNIASRSAKVSARANDNFLFSIQVEEQFLKK